MNTNALASECLAALDFVSGVNHYSVTFFQWQAEHDMAIATFTRACHELRLSDNDPASRGEKYDEYVSLMDRAIIDATDQHYPIGEDGKRHDREAEMAPVFKPVVVASNDIPHEVTEPIDDDGTIAVIGGEETDQQAEPIAAAG